jgi:GNAT superfamily N-acetyltransferase
VRPGVCTRPATADDLDGLVTLCLEARSELQVGSQLCSDDPQRLRDQLVLLMSSPGGTILTGTVDDEVAGLLLARVVGPGPFSDVVALNLEALYVRAGARRRGLGHALLVAAASLADEVGATEVYASPLPGARGMHRFLARIGFAPAAAHRVVTTSALQRRLAQDPSALLGAMTGRLPRQRLEDLIARRRQARALQVDAAATSPETARQARSSISMQVNRAVQTRRPSSSTTAIS